MPFPSLFVLAITFSCAEWIPQTISSHCLSLSLVWTENIPFSNPCQLCASCIPCVTQCQVRDDRGYSVFRTLRSVLRHEDIIMVGEIRDRETARFAIEASLTGHLVLSTLIP